MIPTVGFNMRKEKTKSQSEKNCQRWTATHALPRALSRRKVTKGNVTIKLWDLGGQPRFRSMWERYCRGMHAIVYVVDAADSDSIATSKAVQDAVRDIVSAVDSEAKVAAKVSRTGSAT